MKITCHPAKVFLVKATPKELTPPKISQSVAANLVLHEDQINVGLRVVDFVCASAKNEPIV